MIKSMRIIFALWSYSDVEQTPWSRTGETNFWKDLWSVRCVDTKVRKRWSILSRTAVSWDKLEIGVWGEKRGSNWEDIVIRQPKPRRSVAEEDCSDGVVHYRKRSWNNTHKIHCRCKGYTGHVNCNCLAASHVCMYLHLRIYLFMYVCIYGHF